ncbi:MAG: M48 family metalloprotease, partial [Myxococcales bacterium]|nr:M48 family metalloprotease [Myxococcales bacterium]
DFSVAKAACSVAGTLGEDALMQRCTNIMATLAPDSWETQIMVTFRYAMRGELEAARASLERAHAAGLDDDIYQEIAANLVEPESPLLSWGRRAGLVLGGWLALAAFLIGAGFGLSHLTLAEAESVVGKAGLGASASASDSRLHKAYAMVLWLCCAYYYVSVPIILLLVIGLGGGLIWLIFSLGRIPVKIVVMIVVFVGATVVAVLKSFFTRPSDAPPGKALDPREAPGLRALLDEVAAKVGTRPVDTVYLTPGTDIAVFERGGLLAKLRGKGERCLLLGVGVLEGLDTDALRAILAHEYGHFSNEDTAGGNFALGVRRSVVHSAVGLAEAGAAGWYNPAWLFLNGFHRVFLRISQGASRLQEVLADRWAARSYG